MSLGQAWAAMWRRDWRPRQTSVLLGMVTALAAVTSAKVAMLGRDIAHLPEMIAADPVSIGPATDIAPDGRGAPELTAPLPQPAAGPEDEAEEDAPTLASGASWSPSARRPDRPFSEQEIKILHQLAERREQLERRARELDQHAVLIETAEAKLAEQIERLTRLHAEIRAAMDTHDAREEAKIANLVKIYETMKPKAAAEIFDRLEMPVLLRVVERMREAKSADVLARMDPAKAKLVTAALARRTRLLTAGTGS